MYGIAISRSGNYNNKRKEKYYGGLCPFFYVHKSGETSEEKRIGYWKRFVKGYKADLGLSFENMSQKRFHVKFFFE